MDRSTSRAPIDIELDDDEASMEKLRQQFRRNADKLARFAARRVERGDDPGQLTLLCIDAEDEAWTTFFADEFGETIEAPKLAPAYVNVVARPEFLSDLREAFSGFAEELDDAGDDWGLVRAVMLGAEGRLLVCSLPIVTA